MTMRGYRAGRLHRGRRRLIVSGRPSRERVMLSRERERISAAWTRSREQSGQSI
jgi:hypothetical protein